MNDQDFDIDIKQSSEGISTKNRDTTALTEAKSLSSENPEDSFNLKMVILAWIFKIISITIYLVLKLVTSLYLEIFVISVILVSLDFWITKNITGRKLVGLRWYSHIIESGEEQWIFESRSIQRKAHSANQFAFWISQLVFMVFWIIVLIINLLTLSLFWIGLAYFGAMLTTLNFGCYFKCRGEHQKKAKELTKKVGIKAVENMF